MKRQFRQLLTVLLAFSMLVLPMQSATADMGAERCHMMDTGSSHSPAESESDIDQVVAERPDCCEDSDSACNNQCGQCAVVSSGLLGNVIAHQLHMNITFTSHFIENRFSLRNPSPLLRPPENLHS